MWKTLHRAEAQQLKPCGSSCLSKAREGKNKHIYMISLLKMPFVHDMIRKPSCAPFLTDVTTRTSEGWKSGRARELEKWPETIETIIESRQSSRLHSAPISVHATVISSLNRFLLGLRVINISHLKKASNDNRTAPSAEDDWAKNTITKQLCCHMCCVHWDKMPA